MIIELYGEYIARHPSFLFWNISTEIGKVRLSSDFIDFRYKDLFAANALLQILSLIEVFCYRIYTI